MERMPSSSMDFDLESLSSKFNWPEYTVFIGMLLVSAGIGIFFGCFGKKQTTTEFLMAGRSMGIFPMSMSLLASFLSALTLLGTPAEVYQYGTQYAVIILSYPFVIGATAYLYLPVFHSLQVTSAYEYLEQRFDKTIRLIGSACFITHMTIYMALVVYGPALALSQVTGINVYVATMGIFLVCIFYTALGGMKAVMWTDTFQVIVMFGAMLIITIKGMQDVGGHGRIWESAENSSRIEFANFNLDPRERHTVWSLVIGGFFNWLYIYAANQAQVQRYLTVSTRKMAQRALWINFVGLTIIAIICCYAGLIIYTRYQGCDPILSKKVQSPDQLFPLFVMDTLAGEYPGLAGFFVAGIFSGSLSTVSSGLNSLAAISLEDFVKIRYKKLSDEVEAKFSKCISIAFGVLSFGLVFIASQMGTGILQTGLSVVGIVGGPVLGVFSLGMFFPWANSKGALIGMLTSLAFMIWLGVGANISIASKSLIVPKKEFLLTECPFNVSRDSMGPSLVGQTGGLLEFYRLSYMWYSILGTGVVIIVGLVASLIIGSQDPRKLDPRLISPSINDLVKKLCGKKLRRKIGWELGINFSQVENKGTNCALIPKGDPILAGLKEETTF